MILSRTMHFGAMLALSMVPAFAPAAGWWPMAIREVGGSMQAIQPTVELLLVPKVGLGDTVEITLRLRNDGSRPIDLQLPGRPVAFDISILRADNTQVWRRLNRSVVSSALMLLRLPPGGTKDFVVQWTQVDNAGRPVGPGSYIVHGILPTQAGPLAAISRDLLIEPRR